MSAECASFHQALARNVHSPITEYVLSSLEPHLITVVKSCQKQANFDPCKPLKASLW